MCVCVGGGLTFIREHSHDGGGIRTTITSIIMIISKYNCLVLRWLFIDLQVCEIYLIHHILTIDYLRHNITQNKMSLCMRKPTICIGENKGADQLRGNREADQRLCFRYSDSTIPLLLKSEISSF